MHDVVHEQVVLTQDRHLDDRAPRLVERREHEALSSGHERPGRGVDRRGRHVDLANGERGHIDRELHVTRHDTLVEVDQRREHLDLVRAVVRPIDLDRAQAHVVRVRAPEPVVLHALAAQNLIVEVGDPAVGPHLERRRRADRPVEIRVDVRRVRARELQGLIELRAAVGGLDAVHGVEQFLLRSREPAEDLGPVGEGNDHRLAWITAEQPAAVEPFDTVLHPFLRDIEPCLLAVAVRVGRAHRRRVVDQQDGASAPALAGLDLRLHHGEDQQRQGQKLQEQEQAAPELLERSVRAQVLDRLLPEQRAGDRLAPPPQLEKVQQDQRRDHRRGENRAGQRGQPTHLSSPRFRR